MNARRPTGSSRGAPGVFRAVSGPSALSPGGPAWTWSRSSSRPARFFAAAFVADLPAAVVLAVATFFAGAFAVAETVFFAAVAFFTATVFFVRAAGTVASLNRSAPRMSRRNLPVWLDGSPATSSGVPSATTRPPPLPPSGPMSTTQSAVLMTSRLCSMTITEFPLSTRPDRTVMSLLMSSKCKPVVGSSRT